MVDPDIPFGGGGGGGHEMRLNVKVVLEGDN